MKKRIISLGLVIEIITFSIIVSFMSPVAVIALSAGGLQSTIASIIISLMLQCGAAPVNQAWINTLNTSYGVESSIGTIQDCINSGLLTQSGNTLIDTGLSAAIESQSAYTELGLADIFTTSADDVAMGVVAGSGGFNIATTAIHVGTLGTIGAFAGAAAIGVGLGVLANHLYNKWQDSFKYGIPVYDIEGMKSRYSDYMFDGGSFYVTNTVPTSKYPGFYSFPYRVVNVCVLTNRRIDIYSRNLDSYQKDCYRCAVSNNTENTPDLYYIFGNQIRSIGGNGHFQISGIDHFFDTESGARNYLENLNTDDYNVQNYSPDIIGKDGNHSSSYNPNTGYQYDNQEPVVPDGYDMNPVNMDDYQNFVDNANNNTEDGNIGEEIQGEQFDNLIDSLLVEPSLIPDQGIETPDVPDRPIIPDQPDTPGKDPITPEQQADVLEGITTPDLRSVFPFCIPFDLFSLLGELKDVNREAPVLVWEMPEELGGYSIILDFSMFDDAAALLRLLELAVFIVGLAVETRNLIGAKG